MADRIWIENKDQGIIAEQLAESPKRMERATRLAANTALRRAGTPIRQGLSEDIGVPQNRFKFRTIHRPATANSARGNASTRRDAFSRLWIGLDPLNARQGIFGALKQDNQGSWAKKYFFRGAFIINREKSANTSIYKRIGRARFPIKLEGVDVDKPETRALINRVAIGVEDKYTDEVVRLLESDWDLKTKSGR